ncbi:MAG: hypothetical protein V1686_02375 [Patescibacteria group bacterium]
MKLDKEPQFNPAENIEPNIVSNETKRPGGVVPEDTLWQSKIETGKNGQRTEKGIVAPDGTYHELQEGERFIINKGEKGDYEAVVLGINGEKRILRKSFAQEKAEREQEDKEKLVEVRKRLGIEQESTNENLSQAQNIFNNVYEQLKPKPGIDEKKNGQNFVEKLAQYQDVHIEKIDENESIDQVLERIWTEGMAKKLMRFSKDQDDYKKRNADYSEMYLGLKKNINQLIQSGEVDLFTAKVFLENFRTLKESYYYNNIVENPEEPSEEAKEKYLAATQDLYDFYGEDKIIYEGVFYHFNRKDDEDKNVKNRFYLSANLSGSPEKLVSAWKNALIETGLQDKIYFKLTGELANRQETIIVYQTDNVSDEEMGKVMEAFKKLCPEDACAKKNMPSSTSIVRGISYAPEPKNLNKLFRAMDLKDRGDDKKYLQISYNEMIAGFTQLSFELAYQETQKRGETKLAPKNLKDSAKKYFEQMIKLAGINPETMVPNAQGGKLPSWAEKLSKNASIR